MGSVNQLWMVALKQHQPSTRWGILVAEQLSGKPPREKTSRLSEELKKVILTVSIWLCAPCKAGARTLNLQRLSLIKTEMRCSRHHDNTSNVVHLARAVTKRWRCRGLRRGLLISEKAQGARGKRLLAEGRPHQRDGVSQAESCTSAALGFQKKFHENLGNAKCIPARQGWGRPVHPFPPAVPAPLPGATGAGMVPDGSRERGSAEEARLAQDPHRDGSFAWFAGSAVCALPDRRCRTGPRCAPTLLSQQPHVSPAGGSTCEGLCWPPSIQLGVWPCGEARSTCGRGLERGGRHLASSPPPLLKDLG